MVRQKACRRPGELRRSGKDLVDTALCLLVMYPTEGIQGLSFWGVRLL